MTEVMARGQTHSDPSRDRTEYAGEIIEERRKDAEGRIGTYKYLKGKMLGKGGFAKCYVGTSMRSRNQYALKIVSKSTLVKPRAEQKLRSEIRIHRTLNHDSIVRFERYFEDGLNAYLLLELCSNNSMSDLMKRRKKLVEFEARYYVSQIVSSLKYLHKHNVIHRDLKLGNLFINQDMRVKVGDFGLATKLTRPDERKKTICGTPNYIAPEILEGKNGHSFEVDIWSTGVILYTLLVGKPPFEAKDVKSTYKRIVANQYSFPDHTVVSPEAKDIIRFTLQQRPEKRPTLDQMADHPFFSGPDAYCPTSLPETCLRDSPLLSSSAAVPAKKVGKEGERLSGINDENDPHAMNRVEQPLLNVKVGGGSHARPVLGERPSSASAAATSASVSARASASQGYSATATVTAGLKRPASASASASAKSGTSAALGMSGDRAPPAHGQLRRASSTGSTTAPSSSASAVPGPYQQAFDIYQDSGSSNRVRSSGNTNKSGSFGAMRQSGLTTNEDISQGQYTSRGSSSSSASLTHQRKSLSAYEDANAMDVDVDVEVDRINSGFKHVQISQQQQQQQQQQQSAWSEANAGAGASASASAHVGTPVDMDGKHKSAPSRPLDTLETMHKMLNRSLTSAEREAVTANGYMATHAAAAGQSLSPENKGTSAAQDEDSLDAPQACAQEEGEDVGASGAFSRTSAARSSDAGDTGLEDLLAGKGAPASAATTDSAGAGADGKSTAKVWVVRYVDYTSKYGLGFLLNTGSAGVYFNDSTKIVLSADGTVFQYIERRRRESGSAGASSCATEHLTQTHFMSAYPQELQKKVTLLRHFRNYLVDQQRAYGESGSGSGQDGTAAASSSAQSLPTLLPENSSSGAAPSVKFGVSSAVFESAGAVEMGGLVSNGSEGGSEGEMPFLKKWVRTRHAILFRLSNRVVQVVFFDRSEVLLSPEARIVTYVNKTGVREEHSLEQVLHSGRSDISKRLKYTKDIIWRLINVSSSSSGGSSGTGGKQQ